MQTSNDLMIQLEEATQEMKNYKTQNEKDEEPKQPIERFMDQRNSFETNLMYKTPEPEILIKEVEKPKTSN
jgi:hypothetical protein